MNCLVNIRSVQTSPDGQFSIGANTCKAMIDHNLCIPWDWQEACAEDEEDDEDDDSFDDYFLLME